MGTVSKSWWTTASVSQSTLAVFKLVQQNELGTSTKSCVAVSKTMFPQCSPVFGQKRNRTRFSGQEPHWRTPSLRDGATALAVMADSDGQHKLELAHWQEKPEVASVSGDDWMLNY
jgi:hypothetical protein